MSDDKPNLDSLFLHALEIDMPEKRAEFLAQACGEDTALRKEVDKLLASHQAMGSFLELPARELAATVVSDITRHDISGVMNAGLASAFGEDEAVVIGRAGHSVLQSLGQTINIPCIALREVADSKDPVVRPLSAEMPERDSDSRYQLQGEIARGGMGAILKGRDTDLGRELAIKVLLDAHMDRPEVVQRFIEEAQIGGQLQHPGIAPVYELGQFSDRRPYFSMKLVKGETLSKLLSDRAEAAVDRGKFLAIFEQVCQTMAYAHSRGVIHRDLKPTNVMVGAFGEVQVMDWGLAKVLSGGGVADEKRSQHMQEPSAVQTLRSGIASDRPGTPGKAGSHTLVGSVMGTPAYMPPEQALGDVDHLDEHADVFGLGAILCEILTGLPPYVGDEKTTVFHQASHGKLDDCLARLASCGADADLIALAKHCLEVEPKDRPRDASVLAKRVTSYLQSVETKLHATETERAVQAARAEQQHQAAGKLRKMLGGLAVVAMIAVTTSLVAGKFWRDATVAERLATYSATSAKKSEAKANEQKRLAQQNLKQAEKSEREAKTQSNRADREAEIAQRNLYFAQMHLAQQTFREHRGLPHMRELLASWIPQEPAIDRRGWEWFYVNSLPYQNLRTLTEEGSLAKPSTVAWNLATGRLAHGTSDGVIQIWDTEREQVIRTLKVPRPWFQYWGGAWLAWSPDGSRLVTGDKDGAVHIWNSSNAQELHVLSGDSPIVSVAFSSDGSRVAAWNLRGKIKVWDANSTELAAEKSHPQRLTAGAWSPDGKWIASGHDNGVITISDATADSNTITLTGHTGTIEGLAWSPDSTRIASASYDFTARVWDLASAKMVLGPLRHSHEISSIAWEPNGNRLATGSIDETVKIWDTTTGRDISTLRGHSQTLTGLAWGPQDRLAAGGNFGSIRIWTSIRDQESIALAGHRVRATAVAWSPSGKLLATGGDDGQIRIWNAVTREAEQTLAGFEPSQAHGQFGLVRSLAWNPKGTLVAASGLLGGAKVWEVASGRVICTLPAEHGEVWCIAWSPDGSQLAIGSEDGTIGVVEGPQENAHVRYFQAHQNRIRTVAWSPQGDRLASGAWMDPQLMIWDPKQGAELARLMGHEHSLLNLNWSPDGKRLASSGVDRLAIVWNMDTYEKLATMRGHHDFVDAVKWSPDGSRLATAGLDNAVRIWDPQSGEETLVLRGNAGFFHDVSWHPDGAQIAAASSDGQIWIWDARHGFERDTTARALPYIDRLVASGTLRGDEILDCAERYLRFGKPQQALAAVNNDPLALVTLARRAEEIGLATVAEEARIRARVLLEQQRAAEPDNQTLAGELANLLLIDRSGAWTVLKPTAMQSSAGAMLKLQQDGSILVSGTNTSGDTYTFTTVAGLEGIAALRLEALPDDSLPNRGPGRHGSGNFQLSAIRLEYPAGIGGPAPLPLTTAWASFDYRAFDADVRGTIDEGLKKVWHVWGRTGEAHLAMYTVQDSTARGGRPITIQLRYKDIGSPINLGRLRLSISSDPNLLDREKRRFETYAAAQQMSDPWEKLAAAYHLISDQQALEKVLQEHPTAAIGVADMCAAAQQWEQAITMYNMVITDQTTDAPLLGRRATAHAANQQWQHARADWLCAVQQQGDLAQQACDCFWRAERWNEATEFGLKQIEQNPADTSLWIRVAPLAAQAEDKVVYATFCKKVAGQGIESPEVEAAERAIKACLLLPGAIEYEMLPASKLARSLDDAQTPKGYLPWFWATRALLAYRSGDAQSAVKFLAKSSEHKPQPVTQALNLAILALAEHQLQHPLEARRALLEASQLVARLKVEIPDSPDLLIAEILWREAKTLVDDKE